MSHSRDPWAYEPQFWEIFERLAVKRGNESEVLRIAFATERQAVWFQNKCYAFLRAREWAVKDKKVEKERVFGWVDETRACKAFQISREGRVLIWVRKANKEVFDGVMQQVDRQLPDPSLSAGLPQAAVELRAPELAGYKDSLDYFKSTTKPEIAPAYPFNPDDLPEET